VRDNESTFNSSSTSKSSIASFTKCYLPFSEPLLVALLKFRLP
jgi:hypothetical protein